MKSKFLFILVIVLLLNLTVVMAFEFDNVKTYDPNTREVTIVNMFGLGGDIAKIKWNTPDNYHVPYGYQKVAEFNLILYKDYDNAFSKIESYDRKINGQFFDERNKIERTFEYRIKTFETIDVDDFKRTCINDTKTNETSCSEERVGSHQVTQEVWNKIEESNFKTDDELVIGIFTDVQKGDQVEFIPTFFGVDLPEFSTWTADLNVGLNAYLRLNESSGNPIDSTGRTTFNATNIQNYRVAGKINWSYAFNNSVTPKTYAQNTSAPNVSNWPFSYGGWFNSNTTTGEGMLLGFFTNGCGSGSDFKQFGLLKSNNVATLALFWADNDGEGATTTGVPVANGSWVHAAVVATNNTLRTVYVNGLAVLNDTDSDTFTGSSGNYVFRVGGNCDNGANWNGYIDEVFLYNRTLNLSEIRDIYNSTTGFEPTTPTPTITLLHPANDVLFNNNNVTFIGSVSSPTTVANVSIFINNIINETNTSGANNQNYTFNKNFTSDGNYSWLYQECEISGVCYNSSARTFIINGTAPSITLNAPANDTNFTTTSVTFNYTVTDRVGVSSVTLFLDGVVNETNTSGLNGTYISPKTIADGLHNWSVGAKNINGQITNSTTRIFRVDTSAPTINITYPKNVIFPLLIPNQVINFSWTIVETTGVGACYYKYPTENSTNVTIPLVNCTANQSQNFNYQTLKNNLTMFANDTGGNMGSDLTNWGYYVIETGQNFSSGTVEGSTESYNASIVLNSSLTISNATFVYDSVPYSASSSSSGSNYVIYKNAFVVPDVAVFTNKSFYFSLLLSNGAVVNLTTKGQLVSTLGIDNCTTFTRVLYNFTLLDEDAQTLLSNTTIKTNLNFYNSDRSSLIFNFSSSFTNNPLTICLNQTLTAVSQYSLDTVVEYTSTDHETEYYNIRNFELTNSTPTQSIRLYDLLTANSQVFKIIYKDSSFLPVANALIEINRTYVNEGVSKIVELPITDEKGETVGHFVLDDVLYSLRVIKDGVVLETLTNVLAVCQNPSISTCTIEFNSFRSGVDVPNFHQEGDFNFTLDFNSTSRDIISQFIIPSGDIANVTIEITKEDALGTTVCTDDLSSSSGTLNCNVGNNFGNSTVLAKLYKNGELAAQGQVKLDQDASEIFAGIQILLGIFLLLTLIGAGIVDSPIISIVMFMIGVIILFGLNIIANNGFIGATATILYLIIAVIIVLIKSGRRN